MFCHGTSWSAAPCPLFPLAEEAGGGPAARSGKASPSRAAVGPSPDLSPQAGIPGGRPARPHPACPSSIAFRCVRAAAGLPAARPCFARIACTHAPAFRVGAVRAPSVMGRSPSSMFFQRRTPRTDFRHADLKVDRGSLFAGGLNRSGEAWLLLSVRVARLSGALPIGVRRQALASVRGRRGGRQLHAWSSAVPECRSDKACSNATRRFGDKARDAHHRDPRPGEGHRWIATLRACHVPPVVDYRGCAAAPMPRDTPSPPRA